MADALGSTVGLVSSAGSIATSYTYEPFGNVTVGGASNTNPYQFTGHENDGTGLYFYRARYYSPTFQRFVAQDPVDFVGGFNLYAYALNSPGNFRDPSGLWVGGIGVNAGAGAVGAGASRTTEIVFDGQGNVGKATTTCAGGLTTVAAAGAGGAVSFNTGLSTIWDLQGPSLEVGSAFPVGVGAGAGANASVQKNSCGQPTFGINVYLGAAGDWPSIPITMLGLGCNTTVTPITWSITGPTGPELPFPVLVQ